ncbi:hypothetical protein [Nocardia sp. NPDC052566]|uniref:hypothetical protein n=1 Tax=Nocardia sp. NPDC052566 TaxID=3364330 RepID=UPI0037C56ADB
MKDPAAVDRALADLAELLANSRRRMTEIGRHEVADRLGDLSARLQTMGAAIDDSFDLDFRAVTESAAEACVEAAGPDGMRSPDDPNGAIYRGLVWGVVDLVIVRIGGFGTIEHPDGSSA